MRDAARPGTNAQSIPLCNYISLDVLQQQVDLIIFLLRKILCCHHFCIICTAFSSDIECCAHDVYFILSYPLCELKFGWRVQCLVLVDFVSKSNKSFLKIDKLMWEKVRTRRMSCIWRRRWKCLWWLTVSNGAHSSVCG